MADLAVAQAVAWSFESAYADRHETARWLFLRLYEGTVRIARRVLQSLLDQLPTPERYIEAFHLRRIRFEIIAERKLRRRQLTKTGDVEISGQDLRERTPPVG